MPGGALCKAQVASCVFKSASPSSSDGHLWSEFGGWLREPPWLRVSGCYRPCPGRQAASSGTKKRVSLCVGFRCVRWGADAAACRAVGEKRPALSAGLCPCALVSEGDAELALCPPPLNPRRGSLSVFAAAGLMFRFTYSCSSRGCPSIPAWTGLAPPRPSLAWAVFLPSRNSVWSGVLYRYFSGTTTLFICLFVLRVFWSYRSFSFLCSPVCLSFSVKIGSNSQVSV